MNARPSPATLELPIPVKVSSQPETKHQPAHPKPAQASAEPAPARMPPPDFNWRNDPDIVQREVPTVAIYLNEHGNVVVRAEQEWDQDDDTIIVLGIANIPDVIDKLKSLYDER
jgi:hypothetical protein